MSPHAALVRRGALIGLLAFSVWIARIQGPYHFDDWITPVGDPASQSLSAFFEHLTRTLRPLSKLSFALESTLGWRDEPAVRRGVSVLIHAFTSGLLFVLAARLGAGLWAASAAAVLFAVNAIHAESVWALAGRGAAMGLSLLVAATIAQLRGRRWLAAGLFLSACLCRETCITGALPLVAIELARRRGQVLTRLEPVATVVLLVIAFVAQNARYRELIDYSARGRPFGWSVAGQVEALPYGLSLYVRPGALSIDHGEPLRHSFSAPGFWLGVAALAAFAALAIWAVWRRRPLVATGATLVLAALLPTQTLIPKLDPLTERPFAAAFAGVVLLFAAAVRALFRQKARRAALAIVTIASLLSIQSTLARGSLYASDVALWRDAAEKSVVNPRPHYNLALALREAGRREEARNALARAREIDPFDSEMRALAAQLEAELGSAEPP
jgi:hypothetical protein